MPDERDPISKSISDALTGAYRARRMTQESLAEAAEMSVWTLQKKLKGRAPITATDLVVLSRAIGVPPEKILADAESLVVSDAPSSFEAHRKKKQDEAARMSTADIEKAQKRAATDDEELGTDEPEG